jgi:hypothetical protein
MLAGGSLSCLSVYGPSAIASQVGRSHTHSRHWRAVPTSRSEQSAIASVACAPSNARKTLICQPHPLGNDATRKIDIQ